MMIVSRFYDSNLYASLSGGMGRYHSFLHEDTFCPAYSVIDVNAGRHERQGTSMCNRLEAELAVLYVRHIRGIAHKAGKSSSPPSIGIITPYQAQVWCISQKAREFGVHDLDVRTIDSFQGQERDGSNNLTRS